MITRKVFSLVILFSALTGVVTLGSPGAAMAANSTNGVAQTYNAASGVLPGMIVELNASDSTTVIPLKSQDSSKMAGVVVPAGNAAITLSAASTQNQQVLVATTGRYSVLVTSQNGAIKVGDYVAVSALDGIGMKASASQSEIIGRAAGNFDGKTNILGTTQLTNTTGHKSTVSIGQVPVDVGLAANPLNRSSDSVPSVLSKAVGLVTNKTVSPARIYLSVAVLLTSLFITGSVLYAGVRGSITAVGRNPLARRAVNRDLFQAFIFGLIVLAAGVLLTYVILA